jgi:hypothetical protein
MFVRYWQAALLAALATLMGDVVWAQDYQQAIQNGFASGYAPPAVGVSCPHAAAQMKCGEATPCCQTGDCCTEDKCCKEADCCKEGKCCEANKCDCAKGGECCCKKGECKCNKSSCCKGACCGCCAIPAKEKKSATIIVVMPSPLPMFGVCHPESGLMPPPMNPQVMLPCPPPPPMMAPPGLPMPGMTLPPQMVGMPMPSTYYACPPGTPYVTKVNGGHDTCVQFLNLVSELSSAVHPLNKSSVCGAAMGVLAELCAQPIGYACTPDGCVTATLPQPTVVPCCASTAKSPAKLCIVAKPSSDQLEMNVGEETCLHCKKMTVTIGENEITLSRFDDRVRVRGDELKATADSVRSERKDRIILEGDVVLHYKKDGHCANVTGDRIELNLSSGAVTIEPAAAKPSVCPSVRIDINN